MILLGDFIFVYFRDNLVSCYLIQTLYEAVFARILLYILYLNSLENAFLTFRFQE